MERRAFVALRSAVFASLFVLLWTWLAARARRFDPALGIAIPARLAPLGWLIALAGAALGASCVAVFVVRGRGTPAPFDPPREFVAAGPYRFVRNPMYLGGGLMLSGAGLAVGSGSILILAGLFCLAAHLLVIAYEEPALARRFGESYSEYRRRVRRWLPRLRRGS